MNTSILCTIKYMNRSYFSKARYMIGLGFKYWPARPYQKKPQVTPPPPPPEVLGRDHSGDHFIEILFINVDIENK